MTPTSAKIQAILKTFAKDVTVEYQRGLGYKATMTMHNVNRVNRFDGMHFHPEKELTVTRSWVIKSEKDALHVASIHGPENMLTLAEIESIAFSNTNSFVFRYNFGENLTDEERQENALQWASYHLERNSWFDECKAQN